ncbi:tail fiber assembly protein [Microvirgula aerodenitrificans]|uniref:tail fiber assembly protein n=1 Tax=Microvirgula aerodenitrificans TaxID=57480 RepID=UPI0028ED1127|nr:tail fiber assembly protein [Microvirgula aerodenitrificans]
MFYSKSTGGFYDVEIHGDAIPADAVEITIDEHTALLAGQSTGQRIEADEHGRPVLRDTPAPDDNALADAARARRDALITATDYLLMLDYPISAAQLAEVRAYRQALRDVPLQAGFPQTIDWPALPIIAVPESK